MRLIRMVLLLVWVWALALAGGPGLHARHAHDAEHDEEGGGCFACELVVVSGGDLGTVGRVEVGRVSGEGFLEFAACLGFRDGVTGEVWIEGRGPPDSRGIDRYGTR